MSDLSGATLDLLRPRGWDEYVGQEDAKQALEVMIRDLQAQMTAALTADAASGSLSTAPYVQPMHILIVGSYGTGKTTLSKIYASRISSLARSEGWPRWGVNGPGSHDDTVEEWTSGIPSQPYRFAEIEGGKIENYRLLDAYLYNLQVQGVLFVDEFQDVPRKLQSEFYSIMHDGKWRTSDGEVKRHYGFTLIAATTDDSRIARPLLSRFGLVVRLKPYDADETAQIIARAADKLGLRLTSAASRVLLDRGRDNPRTVVQNVDMLKRLMRSEGKTSPATKDDAERATRLRDIGQHGLTSKDAEVLRLLSQGSPVGAKTIAETLNFGSEDNYTEIVEPFLLQRRYIVPTARGRVITEEGRKVIEEIS